VKYCPECGQKLAPSGGGISIGNTSGDVLGAGVSGNKNVFGKEFAYTREGHAIVVNINNPSSQEILEVFKNITCSSVYLFVLMTTYSKLSCGYL
jgi:hypothetical protein